MAKLKVRRNWLKEHAQQYPAWKVIIKKVIKMKAFIVIPAKYGWKDGGVKDGDLLVYEQGIKGPPCGFRLENEQIVCVNYPGSVKPMAPDQFIAYIKRIMERGFSDNFIKELGKLLNW